MKKKILAVVSALSIMLSSNLAVFAEDYSTYNACESSVISVIEDAENSVIKVLFDGEIDPSTLTEDTFYLNKYGSTDKIAVEASVSEDNKTVTFSTAALENGAKYTVTVNGVKCSDGTTDVTPSENYTFTVGAPTVTAQNIADGATLVTNVVNASSYTRAAYVGNALWDYKDSVYNGDYLEITFSEELADETVTKDSLKITKEGAENSLNYTPIVEGDKVKVDLSNLYSNFNYTVDITSAITDKNGAPVNDSSFSFTTGLIAKAPHIDGKKIELVSIGKTGTVTSTDGTETRKSQLTDGLMEYTAIECKQWSDTQKEFYTVDLGRLYNIAAVGAFYPNVNAGWHLYSSDFYVSDTKPTADYIDSTERDAQIGPFGAGGVLAGNNNVNVALSSPKMGRYVALKKISDGAALLDEILVFAYNDKFEVRSTNIKPGAESVTNVENASSYTRPAFVGSNFWDYKDSVYEGDYLEITFSKDIASETVTKDSLTVTKEGAEKSITYTPVVEGNKAKIDLSNLYSNFTYNIKVTSDIQDVDGSFAESYSFSFTTGLIAKAPHQNGKTIKMVSIGKTGTVTKTDGTETSASQLTDGLMETTGIDCNPWDGTNKEFYTVDLGGLYNIAAVGAFYPNSGAKQHLYVSEMYVSETKPTADYINSTEKDVYIGPFGEGGVLAGNNNVNVALSSPKTGRYVSLIKTTEHGGGIARLNEILVFAYVGGTFNEVSSNLDDVTTPITNVSNSAGVDKFSDSCYKEKIEIAFDKNVMAGSVTQNSLVITQNNTGAKKSYTAEVVRNKIYIDICSLESDREYTIKATSDIMATDASSLEEKEITFKTGLIAKAEARDGKAIKLVSLGKTVTNSAGGYTGVYDAQYAQNTDLQTLTNGVLETQEIERIRYDQGDYVTVDLGADYEVAAVGAYWPMAAWHLYNTSVFVTENKPTAEDMQTADVTIGYGSCWNIAGETKYDINNSIKGMTAENGRYVTFKKMSDGHAYLSELYVFAYVDKNAQADFYFTNTEEKVEAKADGADTAKYIVYTASYDNGKLAEVKQGAVSKGENYTYKGFVWEKENINPLLPSIDF